MRNVTVIYNVLARFEARGPYLAYFDKEGGKLKGDIPLAATIAVQESTAEDAKAFELEIKLSDRVYRHNCPDAEERKEWIVALLDAQAKSKVTAETQSNPVAPVEPEPQVEPQPNPKPSTDLQMEHQDARAEEGIPPAPAPTSLAPEVPSTPVPEVAVGTEIDDQVAI